ncbi:hypothetical protein ASE71_33675 [Ensifer sp. Root954]|nr:hypothetical protein ASD49_08630 [Ensifer sp. Root1298]KQX76948.1 hypothetical protein ASD41_08885 [Ensifer sp. Root1312]KRC26190.1 hypothetical protein ASE29_21575 [Ensifer sp. Root74]KRD60238.1 hypothetical protein ASE71_33675 [Ensifer sp. Root954]
MAGEFEDVAALHIEVDDTIDALRVTCLPAWPAQTNVFAPAPPLKMSVKSPHERISSTSPPKS